MSNDNETLAALAAADMHQQAATELAGIVTDHLGGPAAPDAPPAEPVPRAPHPDPSQGAHRAASTVDSAQQFANFLTTALHYPFAGRPE